MKVFILSIISIFISMSSYAISIEDARHLWSRTGFSSANFILKDYSDLTREQAVKLVINAGSYTLPIEEIPVFNDALYLKLRSKNFPKSEKRELKEPLHHEDRKKITDWWFREILNTNNTLQEKMTVFWHTHFTSDFIKVRPPYMLSQNQVFRKNALGNFRELLIDVMHDPAIHRYLDNAKNRVNKLNENLSRELLELYTMGEGDHYSETDIKNIAKALTGLYDDYSTKKMKLWYDGKDHSSNVIFGNRKYFGLDSVLDLILDQDQTAKFITSKLWVEFISYNIDQHELNRLSKIFRESNYDIKTLLSEMLNSSHFWSEKNRNNLIKSPFDLMVSSKIFLNFPESKLFKLPKLMKRSGQRLFRPPDVKGWRGGRSWINADLILERKDLLNKYLKRVTKYYGESDSDFLELALNKADDREYQFFAIGKAVPEEVERSRDRLKYILLNDNFNFK